MYPRTTPIKLKKKNYKTIKNEKGLIKITFKLTINIFF